MSVSKKRKKPSNKHRKGTYVQVRRTPNLQFLVHARSDLIRKAIWWIMILILLLVS